MYPSAIVIAVDLLCPVLWQSLNSIAHRPNIARHYLLEACSIHCKTCASMASQIIGGRVTFKLRQIANQISCVTEMFMKTLVIICCSLTEIYHDPAGYLAFSELLHCLWQFIYGIHLSNLLQKPPVRIVKGFPGILLGPNQGS